MPKSSIQPDKYQSGKNSISVNTKVNTQIWVWDTNKKATKSGCIHISEKLDAVTRKIQTFVTNCTVGQKNFKIQKLVKSNKSYFIIFLNILRKQSRLMKNKRKIM